MSPPSTRTRRLALACAAVAALVGVAASPARAQDTPGAPVPEHPAERAEWIQSELRKLRNSPFVRIQGKPRSDVWVLVRDLMALEHPLADAGLARLVRDADTPGHVVERIVEATLVDHEGQYRLLVPALDRLLQEHGSAFDKRFDDPIRRHATAPLIRRLAGLALDSARRRTFRVEATRMLGRTRKPEALDYLVRIWDSAVPEIANAARDAFELVLPAGFTTREKAVEALSAMHASGLDYWDLQSDLLRNRTGPPPVVLGDKSREYVELAREVVDQVSLDVLLERYLTSSVAEIRQRGARRLAEYPYEKIEQAESQLEARLRVGRACLAALVRERDEATIAALFDPLDKLIGSMRSSGDPVEQQELDAVIACVELSQPTQQALRLRAISFLGKLEDSRALDALKRVFTHLQDSNKELRSALLSALDQIAEQELVAWLIDRIAVEENDEIAGQMIRLLGKSQDAAAVKPLADLLARHESVQVRFQAVVGLGNLWGAEEFPRAREALRLTGLKDPTPRTRESAAQALKKPGPTEVSNEPVVRDLGVLAAEDPDASVRMAAAVSVLSLDERGAVVHLAAAFSDERIWERFRENVENDARQRSEATWAFAAADELLALEDGAHEQRGLDLLAAVAKCREGANGAAPLWRSGPDEQVRGVVRERLATLLLERGRGAEAATWLRELVEPEADRGTADPRERWTILLARALRIQGGSGSLAEARRLLGDLRAVADLDPVLRADALLELARNLLASQEPGLAHTVLTPVPGGRPQDAAAIAAAIERGEEVEAMRAEAKRAFVDQQVRISGLIDTAFGDPPVPPAMNELAALGAPALRYVETALAAKADLARTQRLLAAAGHLTGEDFTVETAPETTVASLAATIERARKALRKRLESRE